MKGNVISFISLLLSVLIFIGVYLYHNGCFKPSEGFKMVDTVFSERVDTFYVTDSSKIVNPTPIIIEKLRVDTVYDSKGNEIELTTEQKTYEDSICVQNDTAIVTSYISGVNAKLDSLNLKLRKSEIVRTNTIEITKYIENKKTFKDRFHVGLQVGYGIGLKDKQFQLFVGVGASFDF